MRYYSDMLQKPFDTEKELQKAENEFTTRQAEIKKAAEEKRAKEEAMRQQRATRAKEVEDAFNHANDLFRKFVKDYGTYHKTFSTGDIFDSLFNTLFRM